MTRKIFDFLKPFFRGFAMMACCALIWAGLIYALHLALPPIMVSAFAATNVDWLKIIFTGIH